MSLDIPSLTADAEFWEYAGYAATGIVVVGVAGEAITELTRWIKSRPLKRFIERASALILLIGLAGEILTQVQANNKNSLIVGILNGQAETAKLELARIKLPRHFTASANFDAVGHKYLAGTKFDLSANADVEPMMLALEVRSALASIGMVEQLSRAANHWTPPNGGMPVGGIIRPGVAVRGCQNTVDAPDKPNPARILGALLADSGLGTKDSPVFNEPADKGDCAIDKDVLHVEIGSKILTPWKPPRGASVVYPSFQLEVPK